MKAKATTKAKRKRWLAYVAPPLYKVGDMVMICIEHPGLLVPARVIHVGKPYSTQPGSRTYNMEAEGYEGVFMRWEHSITPIDHSNLPGVLAR